VPRNHLPQLVPERTNPVRPGELGQSAFWEKECRAQGFATVAGVDEAGRGCLFGPVVAAAVILPPTLAVRGIDDSKQLSAEQRERLSQRIQQAAVAWAVAAVDAATIDRINILEASRLAMKLAVQSLSAAPDCLLADAIHVHLPLPQAAILHGDAVCRSIAAASIVAKVTRDRIMREWEQVYPGYGLASNKGYGTAVHLSALRSLGATAEHRFSYRPVRLCCCAVPSLEWGNLARPKADRQLPVQHLRKQRAKHPENQLELF
jgi:ribonuclease HII